MNRIILILILGLVYLNSCNSQIDKNKEFKAAVDLTLKSDYKNSLEILNKLIRHYPNFDSAYVERGYVKLNLNSPEEALLDLNKAIELNNTNISAYFIRGMAFDALQDYEGSLKNYSHIINLGDKEYLYAALKARAILFDYYGKNEKAFEDFSALYKLDSTNVETLTAMGLIYARKQDNTLALEYYDKAIALDSEYSDAYYKRALVYDEIDEYDKALEDISEAIKINSDVSNFYVTRALIYKSMKMPEKAIVDLTKAIQIDPENGIAYLNRAYIKKENSIDLEGAESDFKEAKLLGYE